MTAPNLFCAVASRDRTRLTSLAAEHQGRLFVDERPDTSTLPFAGLAVVTTDNLQALEQAADVGLYLVCERIIKPGTAAVYGLFPMLAHPELSHTESDAHWRDTHAPLALKHHAYMTQYSQLSVLKTLQGVPFDGFALCGFESLTDLKERFFSEPDSREVIAADIQKFADVKRSPRRLIATPFAHG